MNVKRHLALIAAIAILGLVPASHGQGGKVQIKYMDKAEKAWDFYIGDELVTRYDFGGVYAGINAPANKPIFWPVFAPGNVPVTRSWPMAKPLPGEATDHPHQQSAWFCHGDVIPEGIDFKSKIKNVEGADFWSVAKGCGKIVCTSPGKTAEGDGHASVTTKNEWLTDDAKKIMDETRTIRLYDLGKSRLIVLEVDLHASVCPIIFADTKEGAFGIRINDVINANPAAKGKPAGKGKIQNAEGKIGEKECWGQISAWCDYSGPVDGKEVGLAILTDPKNPQPTCWHVRNYGLMAANPFGREKRANFPAMKGNNELVRLKKGEHLQLRYGMVLHTGDAVSGEVAAAYKQFVKLRDKE